MDEALIACFMKMNLMIELYSPNKFFKNITYYVFDLRFKFPFPRDQGVKTK